MLYQAKVISGWYDINGRKYVDLEFDNSVKRVKIPFRYGRVMCRVTGLTPIQDIPVGCVLECFIERKTWDGETYWILHSVTT
jgi:hypothetical protein